MFHTVFYRRDVRNKGDFTCLAGKREKEWPGGRLPLIAGELAALIFFFTATQITVNEKIIDHLDFNLGPFIC